MTITTFSIETPPTHLSGSVSVGETSYNEEAGVFTATATYTHDGTETLTDSLIYVPGR